MTVNQGKNIHAINYYEEGDAGMNRGCVHQANTCDQCMSEALESALAASREEVKRLREALKAIAQHEATGDVYDIDIMRKTAREALAQGGEKGKLI